MAQDDQLRAETARDIVAARAEIAGRRDQVTAEYDDRLAALDQVAVQIDAGQLDPKAAQAQIRRLLAGDRSPAASPRRAGRTKIGMTVPTARPTQPPPKTKGAPAREGPSATRAHVSVSRSLGQIDQRLIHVLRAAQDADARAEARFEASLLLDLRRSLEGYVEEMPSDPILLASVVEHAEHADATLTDLEAGGRQRVACLLAHDRALASELLALGGAAQEAKAEIARARAELEEDPDNVRPVLERAQAVFVQLQRSVSERFGGAPRSLLDEVLRS